MPSVSTSMGNKSGTFAEVVKRDAHLVEETDSWSRSRVRLESILTRQ